MMPSPAMPMLALALAAGACAHWAGARAWRNGCRRDAAFALALGGWATLMLVPILLSRGTPAASGLGLSTLVIQLTLLGSEAFLLLSAGLWLPPMRWAWLIHVGMALLWVLAWGLDWHSGQVRAWLIACNVGFVVALSLALGAHAWHEDTGRAWALLLVALPVCAVLLSDLVQVARDAGHRSPLQPVVGLELFLAWLALQRSPPEREAPASDARRRQLAQDLHDGVGAQLTSLIAALEQGTPAQRTTAASLRECLLELKLLVDGAHMRGTVLDHLASLRYRVQPLLDLAGVTMHWQVEPSALLERLQGDAAADVLRIAQEALANVVRHAEAHCVLLRCTATASPPLMLLDVCDDGRGLPTLGGKAASSRGRGLSGMRARAARLGGCLQIDSLPGEGTCVRLRVPIPRWPAHRAARCWLSAHLGASR